jgi:hypothetical protein
LPAAVSLRSPAARADTGRMCSTRASTRARSFKLAVGSSSGGVASTRLITESRAPWMAAQKRKSEPSHRIIVASTQAGIGAAESACVGGL